MSEQPKNTNADEVDLGQLFLIIGRGFQKLFDFIGSIFKGIFHVFILFLLLLQKNFLILILAAVIGAGGGFLIDIFKTPKYISKMVVKPNFDSTQQLYNNIEFYDELAKEQDSLTLSSVLDVSVLEASRIKDVSITPYQDDNQKFKLYNTFLKDLDSAVAQTVDFEDYLENFNMMNVRFHEVSIVTTDREIARKTQSAIIESVASNDYFKLQKSTSDANIKLQGKIYKEQLAEIDSLQQFYRELMIKEVEKNVSGTNIDLSSSDVATQSKELALLKERDSVKIKLVELNSERADKSAIVNVISDFPDRGVKMKGFWNSYKIVLPSMLIGIVVFILLLLRMNTFLNDYTKKLN